MSKPESGWLIEDGGTEPARPAYLCIPPDRTAVGSAEWTFDSVRALRFARRCDAEAMASTNPEQPVRVTYHEWA